MTTKVGVGASVKYLAECAKKKTDDPEKLKVLDEIATITTWLEKRDLSTWDSNVSDIIDDWDYIEDGKQVSWALIGEIFELGRFNLYGRFSPGYTQEELESLLLSFSEKNIPIDASASSFDVSKW
jgi:hypothetical protein